MLLIICIISRYYLVFVATVLIVVILEQTLWKKLKNFRIETANKEDIALKLNLYRYTVFMFALLCLIPLLMCQAKGEMNHLIKCSINQIFIIFENRDRLDTNPEQLANHKSIKRHHWISKWSSSEQNTHTKGKTSKYPLHSSTNRRHNAAKAKESSFTTTSTCSIFPEPYALIKRRLSYNFTTIRFGKTIAYLWIISSKGIKRVNFISSCYSHSPCLYIRILDKVNCCCCNGNIHFNGKFVK